MGRGNVKLIGTMIQARKMLVVLLISIATGSYFWYPINGDILYKFLLCHMLGFREYYAFFVAAGLVGYTGPKNEGGGYLENLLSSTQIMRKDTDQ